MRWILIESLLGDVRYAVRQLRRSPAFTVAAVLTLALGIGANTAIFSVVNAVFLRPLPYRDARELVLVWSGDAQLYSFSYPRYVFLRDHARDFARVAAYDDESVTFTGSGEPIRIEGGRVSSNFFSILGIAPEIGRTFSADEDHPGATPVAVLSHHLWEERFHSDPKVIGRSVRVDSESFTVIGVLPASVQFLGQEVEIWRSRIEDTGTWAPASVRLGASYLTIVARLRKDVTLRQAQTKFAVLDAQYKKENPGNSDAASVMHAGPLQEQVFAGLRLRLLLLWGSVGCLLLIACANVANLMLSRAISRRKETAVRLAMGATRGRVARQLLTESVVVALAGGILGLPLAEACLPALVAAIQRDSPQTPDVHLDGAILAFTFGISLIAGLGFGLAPVLLSLRSELQESLHSGERGGADSTWSTRFRGMLVAAEVALSIALLSSASLLLESFLRMRDSSLGVRPEHISTIQLRLGPERYERLETRAEFYNELLRRVNVLPGIAAAGITSRIDFVQHGLDYVVHAEGAPDLGPRNPGVGGRSISPDYLRALGIPLLRGRYFTERDNISAPRVMLVNESFARRFFLGQDPIGKHVTYSADRIQCEIVGVVRDVRHLRSARAEQEIYLPLVQRPFLVAALVARSTGDPRVVEAAIRHQVQETDPEQATAMPRTFQQVIEARLEEPYTNASLVLVFAAAALSLAAIGIYGVMAYTVTRRRREIGIRMALGAPADHVRAMVIRQSMRLVFAGVAAGIPISIALGRLYSNLLFGVKPTDPRTFITVVAILTAVALAASYAPARRASEVDPIVVLRAD